MLTVRPTANTVRHVLNLEERSTHGMGVLSFKKDKFYFAALSEAEDREAFGAGFVRTDEPRHWRSLSFTKAQKLRGYADTSAERKLKKCFITNLVPPDHIVYPDELTPYVHQLESTWHAVSRTPALIGDDAGTGKSAAAIMAVNSDPGPTVIVCPPYLEDNWRDELSKWGIKSGHQYAFLPDSKIPDRDFYLEHLKSIAPVKWLIVDESHRFKSEDALRTDALYGTDDEPGLVDYAERVLFLSGTPMPNGQPIELWPMLSRAAPEAIDWMNKEEFGKHYCAGKMMTRYEGNRAVTSWDFSGASNLKELNEKLKRKFMIRHLSEECLDLKKKIKRLVFLDAPKKLLQFEAKHLRHLEWEELLGIDTGLGPHRGKIAAYRKEVGVAKVKGAIAYVTDLLESIDGKVLIAAHHIEVVDALHKALERRFGCLKIQGGMTPSWKAATVHQFQDPFDPCRVLVGNALSMGLGVTLTAASRGVYVEPDWVPGTNSQMEDRLQRISQTKQVIWDYIALRGSLDERMLRRALGKEKNIRTGLN